jgi:emfourin
LRAKVGEAGLFDLTPADGGADQPARPDVPSYEITVSDDERTNTVVLGEADLSAAVRALLTWLHTVPGHHDTTGY